MLSALLDVEILVQHYSSSGRSYSQHTLGLIMRVFVILHNMIIDDDVMLIWTIHMRQLILQSARQSTTMQLRTWHLEFKWTTI